MHKHHGIKNVELGQMSQNYFNSKRNQVSHITAKHEIQHARSYSTSKGKSKSFVFVVML